MKFRRALIVSALALACVPGSANAQGAAPPGNSAVDQYRESVPAPGSTEKLSRAQRERLAERGRDGADLADALDRNGGVSNSGSAATEPSAAATTPDTGASPGGGRGTSTGSSEGKPERDSTGPGAADKTDGGSAAATTNGGGTDSGVESTSTTEAAASSTVGPVPVWGMIVAAMVVVAVGLVVRRRTVS